MKRILFLLLIIPCFSFSQNLSMSELLSLRKNNIGLIEEYLTSKKWNFIGSDDLMINFSYNQENYGKAAESFIKIYYYQDDSNLNWLSIQIHKKEKYTEYLNALKSFGCVLIDSKVKDGKLVKTYQGKTLVFEVSLEENNESYSNVKSIYNIFILPIEEYREFF